MFCCQHILAGAALADSVYELFAVCVTQFQHRLLAVLSVKIRTKQAMHGCLSQWSTLLLQGMVELQKMQAAQQKEAAAAARQAAHEDSDEDSDAKVDKQRAWDDWKDEHPSGWGNSKLRPTA